MVTTWTSGSITSSASEQNIWNVTADEHFAGWIFTHNMTAAETIVIRIYVKDQDSGTITRTFQTITLTGVQTDAAYYIPWLPTKQHKVTIQRTAGTDKAYPWMRAETP